MVSSVLVVLLGPFFTFHCWLMRHNMTTIDARFEVQGPEKASDHGFSFT